MKAATRVLIVLSLGIVMSVSAAAHSASAGTAMRASATPRASGPRNFAFHRFPIHREFIFLDGGFWWGYPYAYPYYYGYPTYYYGESFEHIGKQWGKDLKHGKVSNDDFVTFLRYDVVNASDEARSHFQVGFLKGYGKNGLSFFTRALMEAKKGVPPPRAPAAGQAPSTSAPPASEQPAKEAPLTPPKAPQ